MRIVRRQHVGRDLRGLLDRPDNPVRPAARGDAYSNARRRGTGRRLFQSNLSRRRRGGRGGCDQLALHGHDHRRAQRPRGPRVAHRPRAAPAQEITHVMTVRGPIPPQDLGVTLMHEHLFIDLSFLWDPPTYEWQKPLVDGEITLATRGLLNVDPYVSRSNLVLDDFDAAI